MEIEPAIRSKPYDSDSKAMVRVGPMVNLPFLVRSLDVDPEPLFASCGFSLSDYQDTDHLVPYEDAARLLAKCAKASNCPHLGLLLGQMSEPTHLGIPGFLVHAAPSVREALTSLVETLDLHEQASTAAFEEGDGYSTLSYVIDLGGLELFEVVNDLVGVLMCKIMKLLCGAEWKPHAVRLQRREADDRALYRRVFNSPVYYDSTVTEITFSSLCLDEKPPTSDALLYRHLLREAQRLHDLHRGELGHALPSVLQQALLSGHFSAPEVADMFGIHERTLHRRLRAAGTSFRQELDEARRKLSEQLLSGTRMAVGDIATALGYADASGFIRAFERWCGSSPAAWRKDNFLSQ